MSLVAPSSVNETPVPHCFRHPLVDLLPDVGTLKLSVRSVMRAMPFLETKIRTMPCDHASTPVDDVLVVALHLWEKHVRVGLWTEQQLSEWIGSHDPAPPGRA